MRSFCLICVIKFVQVIYCNLPNKKVKAALKEATKGTDEYDYLHQVSTLMSGKTKVNREIKKANADLKEAIYARIEQLTNDEIDRLMKDKWFENIESSISKLVKHSLESDLQTLQELNDRYAETISELDDEISKVESEFEDLLKDLVVK